MTIRIAGAALAACVSACALMGGAAVQRAEAAEITITGSGVNDFGSVDIYDNFSLSYDNGSVSGTLNNDHFYTYMGKLYDFKNSGDVRVSYNDTEYPGYTDLTAGITSKLPNVELILKLSGGAYSANGFRADNTNFDGTVYVGASQGMIPVPLPIPAPLFGTALLALAGIGWSARMLRTQ